MELGQLQVNTITSRAKIPVAEVTVLVTQGAQQPEISPKKDQILGIAVTNYSGNTPILSIPAPPLPASTTPAKRQGYTLVDLWVEHPDFITQKILGVQIFPGIHTLQSVLLLPLPQGDSSLVAQTQVELPTQPL